MVFYFWRKKKREERKKKRREEEEEEGEEWKSRFLYGKIMDFFMECLEFVYGTLDGCLFFLYGKIKP